MERDLRQSGGHARPGRRRRQRGRVHHHQARLMAGSVWFVLAIVLVALTFDFINGFHDAANSIATVVSTRVLSPSAAVIWAAFWNFIAAFVFGTAIENSLGHGTNDAQKTMGIIVALLVSSQALFVNFPITFFHLSDADHIPPWVIVAAGAAIGLGTMAGGWRIVRTMGQRITKLTPFGGFCAETSGAITLFLASHFGIPVSTTHTITGAIAGGGAAQRLSAVAWGVAGATGRGWAR